MPTRDPQPQQHKELCSDSERLMQLINKFGMHNIPDEELESLGYCRNSEGQIIRGDVLKEREEKTAEEQESPEERDERLEQKFKERPFGRLDIRLTQEKIAFRKLTEEQVDKIHALINEKLETNNEIEKAIIPEQTAYWVFKNELERYISDRKLRRYSPDLKKRVVEILAPENAAEVFVHRPFLDDYDVYDLSDYDDVNDIFVTNTAKSRDLYFRLEQAKGGADDQQEMRKDHIENLQTYKLITSIDCSYFEDDRESEKFEAFMNNQFGLGWDSTEEQFITKFYQKYFETYFQDSAYDWVKSVSTIAELQDALLSFNVIELPSVQRREFLKKVMSSATVEEKRAMSLELREISEKSKKETAIIQGACQAIAPYQFITNYQKKKIKVIQDMLRKKGEEEEQADYYLDGEHDETLDRNPGAVSGDCTNGRPLPFDDPDIPVYNVKVFDSDKRHIGNIYLLYSKSGERKVWHLEAIQVPGAISWRESFAIIIEAIAKEAKKKGISMITVNEESHHISNFDYISEAVINYHKKQGEEMESISMPATDPSKNASFQGNGSVRVIWEAEKSIGSETQ
jgi:hypothetical protein